MKKAAILGTVLLAVATLGAQRVSAYCLELVNYCDRVQVDVIDGIVIGKYDWTCDGITLATAAGSAGFGTGTFASDLFNDGTLAMWDVNVSTSTMDGLLTDGTTLQLVGSDQFTITPGACSFVAADGVNPRGLNPFWNSVPTQ